MQDYLPRSRSRETQNAVNARPHSQRLTQPSSRTIVQRPALNFARATLSFSRSQSNITLQQPCTHVSIATSYKPSENATPRFEYQTSYRMFQIIQSTATQARIGEDKVQKRSRTEKSRQTNHVARGQTWCTFNKAEFWISDTELATAIRDYLLRSKKLLQFEPKSTRSRPVLQSRRQPEPLSHRGRRSPKSRDPFQPTTYCRSTNC